MTPVASRLLARALVAGVLVVTTVSLTACGRRGPLEAPPAAAAAVVDPADPGAQPDGPQRPDRPFVLDPLL